MNRYLAAVIVGVATVPCWVPCVVAQDATQDSTPQGEPDPELLDLQRAYVRQAERLAAQYLRDGQYQRARQVWRSVLSLVPDYGPAREALAQIEQAQLSAARAPVVVQADRGWQDTGVRVVRGCPLRIQAAGEWTFTVAATVGPDGVELPEQLQGFRFGQLIGVIVRGGQPVCDPFAVGSEASLEAPESGSLFLRIHCGPDTSGNSGRLQVVVSGDFEQE